MFLLDTNVVSEMRRPRPDLAVRTWFEGKPRTALYLGVVSVAEMAHGAVAHADPLQRHEIQRWLDGALRIWFPGRILEVTEEIAQIAGAFMGTRQRGGKPLTIADALIAASAVKHRLILVTRNVEDFFELPVDVYDPWVEKLIFGEQRR